MSNFSSGMAAGLLIFLSLVVFVEAQDTIPDDHLYALNNDSLAVDRLSELKIGASKLNDVQKIFGPKEYRRRTYKKTLLPKRYKNKNYSVYRLVNYTAHSIDRKEYGGVVETSWKESMDITFFFDKNEILLLHTVRHQHHTGPGKTKPGKYHNIVGDPDELWPGSVCDGMFHRIYETREADGSKKIENAEINKCPWLDKLKADVKSGVVR